MTDRDRLKRLIAEVQYLGGLEERVADRIIADGWTRPPCKVGDKVYYPYDYGNKVLEKTVKRIVIENNDKWLDVGVSFLPFENIGKTAFLTKEEAEKALAERKDNNG